jgi:hypothetical protein
METEMKSRHLLSVVMFSLLCCIPAWGQEPTARQYYAEIINNAVTLKDFEILALPLQGSGALVCFPEDPSSKTDFFTVGINTPDFVNGSRKEELPANLAILMFDANEAGLEILIPDKASRESFAKGFVSVFHGDHGMAADNLVYLPLDDGFHFQQRPLEDTAAVVWAKWMGGKDGYYPSYPLPNGLKSKRGAYFEYEPTTRRFMAGVLFAVEGKPWSKMLSPRFGQCEPIKAKDGRDPQTAYPMYVKDGKVVYETISKVQRP